MKLKIFMVILGFLVLLSASEIIYQINNNPVVQFKYQIYLARLFITSSQPNIAFRYIGKVVDYKLQNPNLSVQKALEIPNLDENTKLNKEYAQYLKSLNDEEVFQTDLNAWAKILYTLGLLAYNHNEPTLVESFWQSAINFAPQWSYFHIELANYHLLSGDRKGAEELLDKCINLNDPKFHCQEFKESNFDTQISQEPGFLKEEIEKNI